MRRGLVCRSLFEGLQWHLEYCMGVRSAGVGHVDLLDTLDAIQMNAF